ncbi:LysR substrate-binding domain-containing protein [Hathewaya limosa]|uniref:DNA-binding transcriptional LysR family regulator n=1 Tax=Hathewaya limosa TaxID=1536 RepID=A0ABU0JSH0_HATLI|nr:LysR substrate-binding domain-containing protein [Hathewaya limosa]MDQ0480034.1 DNA-binding transcriptional LysR family regulator [Hathewaya limosa]
MFDELKTFIAVVEYKNFTKAGEHINLSQPTVSLHIKRLEEYFETTLIQRSVKQKNIVITKTGEILYSRAKQLSLLLDETTEELKGYTDSVKGELHIGASLTIGEYFLPKFLSEFCSKYPELHIEVTIQNTEAICKKVKNLDIDVGLVEGIICSSTFISDNFYKDKMVLAVPYNNYLSKEVFKAQNFNNEVWISREEGSGTGEYLKMFLGNHNINPKNVMVFGSNLAVKEGVKNNLGITFVSSFVVNQAVKNKEISIIDTGSEFIRNFTYILPKNTIISKGTKTFIDMLMKNK